MKKQSILERIIEEAYIEVLKEQAVLKTSSEEVLQRFPTLRKTLTNLLTKDYPEFIDQVKWLSPKPTSFEVKLRNGENFFLKWDGEGFVAEIAGKSYYLESVQDYQRALSALGELLQTGPIRTAAELEADAEDALADDDSDPFAGGGDDFGGDDDFEADEEPEEEPEPDFEEI